MGPAEAEGREAEIDPEYRSGYHPAMKLTVNGETRDLPVTRVDELLDALGMAGQAVAVELNEAVVPKKQHAETALNDGDVLELVTLVGGG